jgi:tripartite motif-containing protein 71
MKTKKTLAILAALLVYSLVRATAAHAQEVAPSLELDPSFGKDGRLAGRFQVPYGIASRGDGHLFVADIGNDRVVVLDSDGNFLTQWGESGSAPGQLDGPVSLDFDSMGNLYVVEWNNNRIQKFDSSGKLLDHWVRPFRHPLGIAVKDDRIYVSERDADRILVFDTDGQVQFQWGSHGDGDGQFRQPSGLALDRDGNVYVVERQGHRVQKFSGEGAFLGKWGTHGGENGQIDDAIGVALDGDGRIYICERGNDRLTVLDRDMAFLSTCGAKGSGPGLFSHIAMPYVDAGRKRLLVADGFNHRIQAFSLMSPAARPDAPAAAGDDAPRDRSLSPSDGVHPPNTRPSRR